MFIFSLGFILGEWRKQLMNLRKSEEHVHVIIHPQIVYFAPIYYNQMFCFVTLLSWQLSTALCNNLNSVIKKPVLIILTQKHYDELLKLQCIYSLW